MEANRHEFDWESAIARNFEALERVVARLFALAGIATGRPSVETVSRGLHARILAVLRPAEYALRRLIVMAACRLAVAAPSARAFRAGMRKPGRHEPKSDPAHVPAFRLFDPVKSAADPWLTPAEIAARDRPASAAWPAAPALPAYERIDARGLCGRIVALRSAMADLDGQALRLARWRARRSRATCRPRRFAPMRPGRPPGWMRRPKTGLQEVLVECDLLARYAWKGPDTS